MILVTITKPGHFPWLETSSFAGIGYMDDFRDAAIAQSWSHYGAITHGIHGLLYSPYHSLSVFFSTPFTNEKLSIFEFFTYSSLIFIPTILSYGVWSVLHVTSSKYTKTYLPVIFFCLFFLFIGFNYIFLQRSVQIASLLYVSAIPLLIVVWTSTKVNIMAFALLSVLIPLIFFARVYHGLILAAAVFPLLIDPKTRITSKIMLTISAITTLMIIFLFYGVDPRNAGLRPENLILSLVYQSYWLIDPVILLFIMLIVGTLLFRQKKSFFGGFKTIGSRTGIVILIVVISPFIFSIKSNDAADIFYTFLPTFFISYVFLFSEGFSKLLYNSPEKIITKSTIKKDKNIWKPDIKKIFFLLIFLVCLTKYWEYLRKPEGGIKAEIKSWRTITDKWKTYGRNPILLEETDLIKVCDTNTFDPFCLIRGKIFGTTNLDNAVRNSLQYKMGKKASDLAAGSDGVTAVYIPPNHEYWAPKYSNQNTYSVYFMARWGIPIVFGALPGENMGFSYPLVRANGGTLRSLLDIGGIEGLCLKASKFGISNIIVFFKSKKIHASFYNCSIINKKNK